MGTLWVEDGYSMGRRWVQYMCVTFWSLPPQLEEALQKATQATAELSLQQKLRDDALLRVEEMEESLLERGQELQIAQQTVSRLQGQVKY